MDTIIQETGKDPALQWIRDNLKEFKWKEAEPGLREELNTYHGAKGSFKWKEGCLFKGDQLVPPPPLRRQILEASHMGHPGKNRMLALLREEYWWPGMARQAE